MIDTVQVKLSCFTIEKLNEIENKMMKKGMAEQDINFIIGRLCDIYLTNSLKTQKTKEDKD